MTVEVDSSDLERPETNGRVGSRAYYWITSALPIRVRTILNGPNRVVQALRFRLRLPERIRFWFTLKRLQRDKAYVYKAYEKRHEENRSLSPDQGQIERINDEEIYDLRIVNEKIYQLYCQHIIFQAERHLLPIPEFRENGGDWEVARISRRWRLRREALAELFSAIRKKKREQREAAQANLIWVTAFTGIIGALIGLMAVMIR